MAKKKTVTNNQLINNKFFGILITAGAFTGLSLSSDPSNQAQYAVYGISYAFLALTGIIGLTALRKENAILMRRLSISFWILTALLLIFNVTSYIVRIISKPESVQSCQTNLNQLYSEDKQKELDLNCDRIVNYSLIRYAFQLLFVEAISIYFAYAVACYSRKLLTKLKFNNQGNTNDVLTYKIQTTNPPPTSDSWVPPNFAGIRGLLSHTFINNGSPKKKEKLLRERDFGTSVDGSKTVNPVYHALFSEVIDSAIALKMLFGPGELLSLLLMLSSKILESLVMLLVAIVGIRFVLELRYSEPNPADVLKGYLPSSGIFTDSRKLYIAIGNIGATVMPLNLYLHPHLVKVRKHREESKEINNKDNKLESGQDIASTTSIFQSIVTLLIAGQSSTLTATIAGQIVMEGFLGWTIRPWLRRLLTRIVAIVPAMLIAIFRGEQGLNEMLVASQVALSIQLPFAVIPLVYFTSSRKCMEIDIRKIDDDLFLVYSTIRSAIEGGD
ncbi:19948_t:CDS:10 [Entrophospora sp. SA101]|nr:19948_t:CDS:10 [Entrophospora sp. SA101]